MLIDAEATFVWTRIAVLGRKLKVPKTFQPGKERLEILMPMRFSAY